MKLVKLVLVLGVLGGLGWVGWSVAMGEPVPGLSLLMPGEGAKPGKKQAKAEDAPAETVVADAEALAEPALEPDVVAGDTVSGDAPVRAGVVGVLTRIETHGRATGVVCGAIDVPEHGSERYGLEGRGDLSSVAAFLAALEQDPAFAGIVDMHVWSEDERWLGFACDVLHDPSGEEG